MQEQSITALLDWVDLVKTSLPELETVIRRRLELEHEYEHVASDLKSVNRTHAAELDMKVRRLIELYKEDLNVHTARITL